MKWLKRRLQKWLGISAIANRLVDIEIKTATHEQKAGANAFWDGVTETLHPIDNDSVRKGYDKKP